MKALHGTGIAAVALAALAAACGGGDPDYTAELRRTQYGLVHVKADDYRGLGYGYGYAVAQDQLCLLSDRVRTLRGERSGRLGPDGPALVGFLPLSNLASDLFYRVQLSDEEVETAWAQLSADAQGLAEGYARGFSRYVREMKASDRDTACGGVEPLTMKASDVVRATMQIGSLWKAFLVAPYGTASRWEDLASAATVQSANVVPAGAGASNAWAFGAEATGTGSAVVVANPHAYWQDHWLLMHQVHLRIPGKIDVMGADFIGLPLPLAGFTRDVAWSIEAPSTVTYPLLVAVELQAGAQPAVVVDGVARPLERKRVKVAVRQADGSVQDQVFELPRSHLGPLYRLPAQGSRPAGWYAVTDPNQANARGLDQMLAAAKARNVAEFESAVADHRGITAHLIAGDRHGGALYIESGPLLDASDDALRACGIDPAAAGIPVALDGRRAECALRDAQGRPRLAPPDRIPALSTRGVVQNANDNYTHAVFGQRFDGYSSLLGSPLAPPNPRTRMSQRQIEGYLAHGGVIDTEKAQDMVFANRNYMAETLLDDLLAVCRSAPPAAGVDGSCNLLAGWDRRNDTTSRGALFFNELWRRIGTLPALYAEAYDPAQPFRVRTLSTDPAVADQIVTALQETAAALQALGLRGDEPWGRVLARGTADGKVGLHGGAGGQGVLNVIETGPLGPDGYQGIVSGTSYMHVVTWEGGRLVARMLVANGQSADPASAHRDDQLGLFAAEALFTPPFSEAEIAADPALRTQRLSE
ncbi:MAG: penicillin acylase family protein [Hydrogenophaga sp.]|uniref:penicillin acylase family protein n=1 Tax=Hydrogenophaga sp. TaxID=1904254 RepID=UPI00260424EE|nr:penicillin acylase family protein [Hydrogenophaga sp.]MCV0438320.1 penicillin acylase family protein [Hydrogenophaga sp.]